jgi:prepilin-type N-terminal cleavage/methylation domain-containing protein
MNEPQAPRVRRISRNRRGFSLMELMIVVVITGVLAAIAIPSFTGYIQKSRTSEAVDFLGVIKLRQEAYRSEFGQYYKCGTSTTSIAAGDWMPADTSGTGMNNARTVPFKDTNGCFAAIGANPGGPVRFGYAWMAGLPSDASSLPGYYNVTSGAADHYFIAQAITDLDGDGIICTYELASFNRSVWFTPDTGWE